MQTDTLDIETLLGSDGPVAMTIQARLEPVGEGARFQPAGFPQIGHVIYRAPVRVGRYWVEEPVCIVDSAASMANHLETVCLADPHGVELHPQLQGLPYVLCETETGRVVTSSLKEGHRLASDYFLDATLDGRQFREVLREAAGVVEVKKDKAYWVYPESQWNIFSAVFRYDPNSLVHGVLFAREQIKLSRILSAVMEAHGASRVGSSGVKFDRLGKTTSGQPIFAVDEETAQEIRATFLLDLALLRSYGRNDLGLSDVQKRLLLEFGLWKVTRLLEKPFRFRSNCFLKCVEIEVRCEGVDQAMKGLPKVEIATAIEGVRFPDPLVTRVRYREEDLFKGVPDTTEDPAVQAGDDEDE